MKLNKTLRLILISIAALIVIQLLPGSIAADRLNTHSHNSRALILSSYVYADVLYIHNENQKTSIQKCQINNSPFYIYHQIYTEDFSIANYSIIREPIDYRKIIRQSIPHYFNGSKNKGYHNVIEL